MPNFFINVIEKGAKKAQRNIKGLTGSLSGLATKASLAAAGGVVLFKGLQSLTNAAAEQELQEKKLAQALGSNTDALLKQAGALQQTSRFGDEAIIQQQAYLASIGLSEKQIKEMIPVTLDLAAATGMSLESAVKNTAKTLSGMTGELGESVGSLKELTAEELKAGKGIEVMRKMFKGAAEVETQTFTGSVDQMKNALGDAAEAIGSLLIPLLLPLTKGLKFAAEGVVALVDGAKSLFKVLTGDEEEGDINNLGKSVEDLGIKLQKVQKPQLDYLKTIEKQKGAQTDLNKLTDEARKKREQDLVSLVSGNSTILGEIRTQIKAKFASMIAGLISREIGTKGILGLALAPIAAAGASQLFNKIVPSFAQGGDFVTSGPQLMMVGDNPSGRERVQITPLGGDPSTNVPSSSINISVSGNVMSQDFVEGELADQIKNALRRGTDFGF